MPTDSIPASDSAAAGPSVSKRALWAGRILSAVPVLILVFSAAIKFAMPSLSQEAQKGFTDLGWDVELAITLGIVELACAIAYAIPQTAVLGAILVTAYLGGATAAHVRISDPLLFSPVILGIVAWLGLLLREPRLRPLLPLRR